MNKASYMDSEVCRPSVSNLPPPVHLHLVEVKRPMASTLNSSGLLPTEKSQQLLPEEHNKIKVKKSKKKKKKSQTISVFKHIHIIYFFLH